MDADDNAIVISSEDENMNVNNNENNNEDDNENESEEERFFRQICLTWPSVYASEQERGRTVIRCLICDEIKDSITGSTTGLRNALRHQDDPYHRDQVDRMVTVSSSLTFVPLCSCIKSQINMLILYSITFKTVTAV